MSSPNGEGGGLAHVPRVGATPTADPGRGSPLSPAPPSRSREGPFTPPGRTPVHRPAFKPPTVVGWRRRRRHHRRNQRTTASHRRACSARRPRVDLDDPAWSCWADSLDRQGPSAAMPGQDWLWREERVDCSVATRPGHCLSAVPHRAWSRRRSLPDRERRLRGCAVARRRGRSPGSRPGGQRPPRMTAPRAKSR